MNKYRNFSNKNKNKLIQKHFNLNKKILILTLINQI